MPSVYPQIYTNAFYFSFSASFKISNIDLRNVQKEKEKTIKVVKETW